MTESCHSIGMEIIFCKEKDKKDGAGPMSVLLYLSDFMIPLAVFYIVALGVLMRRPVYDDFVEGAKEGARTVAGIMPTLVGLMVGVGVLRASGFLDALSAALGGLCRGLGFPPELLPAAVVKLFSSSAATGLALDIFKEYGPDSFLGMAVSLMFSCTETVFYTMSIYFMAVKVKKTRYTLAGSLLATAAGAAVSIILAKSLFFSS